MTKNLIIAIDGPSGAGKSTLGRMLARALNLLYIDTGSMYRAVALAVMESSISASDDVAVGSLAGRIDIDLKGDPDSLRVTLGGRDVTEHESRHNTKYWTAAPYYGFGCSAHSYDGDCRRWENERDPGRYVELIEQGRAAIIEETQLSEIDRQAEAVFLGLRMMQGLSLKEFGRRFGADLRAQHENDLNRFREAGLIECNGDLLKLTRAGALLSNEVFAAFV